jgi:hypothetical protein
MLQDRGGNQPIGVSLVLALPPPVNIAQVYGSAGGDMRVPESAGPFEMFGMEDQGTAGAVTFVEPFPDGFRGTTAPAGSYFTTVGDPTMRFAVFFVGTRFIPAVTRCVSTFESVIFMLDGIGGAAAFDLPGTTNDKSVLLTGNPGEKITGIGTYKSSVYISRGLGARTSIPPDRSQLGDGSAGTTISMGPPNSSATQAMGAIPFKLGSAVCR